MSKKIIFILIALSMLFAVLINCEIGKTGDDTITEIDLSGGTGVQKGYYLSSTVWSNPTVSVCWENPDTSNDTERGWVRNAVETNWAAHSTLQFTGWGQCGGGGANIRIRIEDVGPHTHGVGTMLNNNPDGMSLNFTYDNWGCKDADGNQTPCSGLSWFTETRRENWIRANGIHEFGHAVGIVHEQARPENSDGHLCDEFQGGSYSNERQGDVMVGDFDTDSVMNYCNEARYTSPGLSSLDILTIQYMYGTPLRSAFFRLYSSSSGDHFYTISASEKDRAVKYFGYTFEGVEGYLYKNQASMPNLVPLYRLHNGSVGDHFYTTSETDKDKAVNLYGYQYEYIAGFVFTGPWFDRLPLYRLYHSGTGDHFYTTSWAAKDSAINVYGYIDEGTACYVADNPL
ncbi:MAG: hypothetical protein GY754_37050 [bacterium]|nr:hypothetical protein [bacterium]